MQDCRQTPYEPENEEKFHIAEITGTKLEKNDTRFYKVRWEQTWIPASRLRAWQDLIIQFWEGYHSTNDAKVMELDTGCDPTPPVYVLSDCESREEIPQAVASTNSEKRHSIETEQNTISSSVNFDTYPEEEYSDNERRGEVNLDHEKISILGHSKRFGIRHKRISIGFFPYPKEEGNEHMRPEAMLDGRDALIPIKEEPPYSYHRNDIMHHEHPSHGYIPTEKNIPPGGDPYNYRISPLSPTSTRELPHEFQTSAAQSCRNSLSPQGHMVSHDLSPQKKTYYCYLCGKEYRSGTGLKQHLLAHKNEKPFGCKLCHRRYRWKGDLNRHMYTHLPNDELPLKCPECQKGFVRKDKMQLHINFAHGGGAIGHTGTADEHHQNKEQKSPPSYSLGSVTSNEEQNKEINSIPSQPSQV